jgi:hypothetical protein
MLPPFTCQYAFKGSSMSFSGLVAHFFLSLNSIPLFRYTMIVSPIGEMIGH